MNITMAMAGRDLNGDGILDFGLVPATATSTTSVVLGTDALTGLSPTVIAQPAWGDSTSVNNGLTLLDLDSDSRADAFWLAPTESSGGYTNNGRLYLMPARMVYPQ